MDVVEDPTLPLTKGDLDRLRRRSSPAPAAAPGVPSFFESLEEFDHIGFSGTPANMLTSGQRSFLSGEIRVARLGLGQITAQLRPARAEPDPVDAPIARTNQLSGSWPGPGENANQLSGSWSAPPASLPVAPAAVFVATPPIHDAESDDPFDVPIRRRWPWVMALAGTTAAVAAWQLWPRSELVSAEAIAPPTTVIPASVVPDQPNEFAPPPSPPIVEDVDSEGSEGSGDTDAPVDRGGSDKPPEKRDVVATAACRQARDRAEAALSKGEWATLESATRRKECWTRASDAYQLRLRALFELGRFDECIKLAVRDKAAAVKKWKKTCEDAKS